MKLAEVADPPTPRARLLDRWRAAVVSGQSISAGIRFKGLA
jgi:hypothetical protein